MLKVSAADPCQAGAAAIPCYLSAKWTQCFRDGNAYSYMSRTAAVQAGDLLRRMGEGKEALDASLPGKWSLAFACSFFGLKLLRGGLHLTGLLDLFLETIDAALSIDQLLTASEERMAVRAYFHADVPFVSRASTEYISARASHIELLVLGVDPCFHCFADSFRVGTNITISSGRDTCVEPAHAAYSGRRVGADEEFPDKEKPPPHPSALTGVSVALTYYGFSREGPVHRNSGLVTETKPES